MKKIDFSKDDHDDLEAWLDDPENEFDAARLGKLFSNSRVRGEFE